MALTSYTGLVAAIGSWLDRTDLSAVIPDFISMAEAEFNRRLRIGDMEVRAYADIAQTLAVPSDFIGMRSIFVDGTQVHYVSASDFFTLELSGPSPSWYYTIANGEFHFAPAQSSGTVTITYYAKIPALTASNQTNWLFTRAPDLYLFTALMQAEFYGWNDERLPLVKARVDEIIAQLDAEETSRNYGATPLAPRLKSAAYLA